MSNGKTQEIEDLGHQIAELTRRFNKIAAEEGLLSAAVSMNGEVSAQATDIAYFTENLGSVPSLEEAASTALPDPTTRLQGARLFATDTFDRYRSDGTAWQLETASGNSGGTAVSVRDHGAAGNGVTDDAAAFQSAIDEVHNKGGGIVVVPEGRYRLLSGVRIKSRVHLYGVFRSMQDLNDASLSERILLTIRNFEPIERNTAYTSGQRLKGPNGLNSDSEWYECTTGGTTAAAAPAYPTTGGQTVTDGTAVFTCRKRVRTSAIEVDHATSAAFTLEDNNPGISGLVIYYPNQIMPYRHWTANRAWGASQVLQRRIQATSGNNRIWMLVQAGTTGSVEPNWPTTGTGTEVADGSCRWRDVGFQARTPDIYPPTITCDDSRQNCKTPFISNMFMPNSFEGIVFDKKNNLTVIENIWMSAFKKGIFIDRATGQPYVYKVHMTTWVNQAFGEPDDNTDGSLTTATAQYVRNNLAAFEFGEVDWLRMVDPFVHAANWGFRFRVGDDTSRAVTERVARGVIYGAGAEHCYTAGIRIEGTRVPQEGLVFIAPNISAGNGAIALHIAPSTGSDAFVRVIGGCLQGSGATRHAFLTGGSLMLHDTIFPSNAANSNVQISSGAKRFHMVNCVFDVSGEALNIANGIACRVFLIGNDLGVNGTYNNPATKPTFYRAGGNGGGIATANW